MWKILKKFVCNTHLKCVENVCEDCFVEEQLYVQ